MMQFNTNDLVRSTIKKSRKTLLICLLACALMLPLQVFIASLIPNPVGEANYLYATIAIYTLSIVIPFGIASLILKSFGGCGAIKLHKRSFPQKPLLYISGTIGVGYAINLIINTVFPHFVEYFGEGSEFVPTTAYGIFLFYVAQALLPAVLEEWAFRGLILKNLLPFGKSGAIIISSVLFGIMHVDPPRVIFATGLGLLLAICYEYTGSLWISMLIHFVNNAFSVSVATFVDMSDTTGISGGALVASLFIYSMIFVAIMAIIYYSKNGLSPKIITFINNDEVGYKLTVKQFFRSTLLNVGFVPLVIVYIIFLLRSINF